MVAAISYVLSQRVEHVEVQLAIYNNRASSILHSVARRVDSRFGALTFCCYRDDLLQAWTPVVISESRVKSKPRFISSPIDQFLPRINLPITSPFAQFSHLSALSCCLCCSTSPGPAICIHNQHNAYSQPRKGAIVAVIIAADCQHREAPEP